MKLIDNMEVKLFTLKKDLRKAMEKVDFLISDLNKLKALEEAKTRGVKGGKR